MDGVWRVLRFIALGARRLAILVAGMLVVLLGIILIPLPGPGWLVVVAGLAILATEFTWAELVLHHARKQSVRVRDSALRALAGSRRSGDGDDP